MSPEKRAELSALMKQRHADKKAAEAAAAADAFLNETPVGSPESPVGTETPAPAPVEPAAQVVPVSITLDPHQAFCAWLRTPAGIDATDPRLPTDFGRLCSRLEDGARAAFEDGWKRGQG